MAARAVDLRREFHAEPPARDVELVNALVANVAVAVIPVPMPVVMEAVAVERPRRRRAEPQVVVDALWHRLVLLTSDRRAPFVAEALCQIDLAESAFRKESGHRLRARIAPLLGAVLDDDPGLLRGGRQEPALGDVVA